MTLLFDPQTISARCGFRRIDLAATTDDNKMREAVLEQCSSIPPLLAARISLAVICHVMYSKGQIPL